MGESLTELEFPDEDPQGKLGIFQWETIRFSETENSQFNLMVATGDPETWKWLCPSLLPASQREDDAPPETSSGCPLKSSSL